MAKAPVTTRFTFAGYPEIEAGIVHWPLSVIRLTGGNAEQMADLADRILTCWRGYSDPEAFIFAETDGVPHNTITPIARMVNGRYQLDLVLRCNITTPDRPLGVYHPRPSLFHIKKENIGLIEVMGLAVLPARLKGELAALRENILAGADLRADPRTASHADWAEQCVLTQSYTADTLEELIRQEVGKVFVQVLEDAGVYKQDAESQKRFVRFVRQVGIE
jgi:UDPglucose--hexose-1-phosphate uridylyltransferase